jgi:hypothetical protein
VIAPAAALLLGAHEHFRDMGAVEWITAVLAAAASLGSIWLAVRYTLEPGETDRDHVKYSILNDEPAPVRGAPPPRREA